MATEVASLVVGIDSDTKGLIGGLNLAQIAIGAFVGAAVKAAVDYDRAFTRISAISNASADDIEAWRDEVLKLSGETAEAPRELAEALFFLASAGLDANEIMPTLEASAKAAAVGLGSTSDVAKITANALNAYADSGLTAAQVTDTLVAAVREGSAEPDEFAAALGRILPIASKAGVTFDEVTASLAALSNIGLDVNEGVTAMRGLLTALEAPGSQAADTLKSIGISAQEMRDVISEEGILGALRMLEERTGGNIDTLRKIIPNVRALTGAFGLTGQEAEKVQAIFDAVRDSTGSLGEAFATTAESDAFKMRQALNQLGITVQQLGAELVPTFVMLAEALKPVADAIGAIAGPLGAILDVASLIRNPLQEAGDSFENLAGAIQITADGAVTLRETGDEAAVSLGEMQQKAEMAAGAIQEEGAAQVFAAEQAQAHTEALRDQRLAMLALSDSFLGIIDSANGVAAAQAELNRLERQGKEDTKAYEGAVLDALSAQISLEDAVLSYGQELAASGETARSVREKVRELGNQFGIQDATIKDLISRILAYIRELNNIPSTVTTTVRLVGDLSGNEGPAPLQRGGIVTRPTIALIGEAGPEAVVPLHHLRMPHVPLMEDIPAGGTEIVVNVNVAGSVVAEQDLARTVREQLLEWQRRNVTTRIR